MMLTKRFLKICFSLPFAVLLMLFTHPVLATNNGLAPEAVIAKATEGIIHELQNLTDEQRNDAKVRELVLTHILPAIDETRVAMGALSKHWRTATPEQRQTFVQLYRELQIKTYAGAFKAFSGEQIHINETILNPKGDKAIVKADLKQNDGKIIPIDFRLYQKNQESSWLVYDAVIAGLSLVKTYRDQLNEQLQNSSLEQLIEQLQAELNKIS